jgi:dCMP deaminase
VTVRPDWTPYFLNIAHAVAERSDCRRAKVGAVLVDTRHRIVGSGYPGTAAGEPGCLDGACPRGLLSYADQPPLSAYDNCISVHAEANAILHSDRALYEGGIIYVTREPCHWCYKMIKAAGISLAVYADPQYRSGFSFADMSQWRAADV